MKSQETSFSNRITEAVDQLRVKTNLPIQRIQGVGAANFIVAWDNFKIEAEINPPEWIGLEFHWKTDDKDKGLSYSINTDLYNLDDPANYEFAEEIVDDMIEFLRIINDGTLLVGKMRGRPAMVIPYKEHPVLIRKILWSVSTQKSISNIEKTVSKGKFQPIGHGE